jgi:hypothetical protein
MLAAAYRRRGDWSRATLIWQRLHRQGHPGASLELAKFFEHREHDYRTAIRYAAHGGHPDRLVRLRRLRTKLDGAVSASEERYCQLSLWGANSFNTEVNGTL